MFPGSWRVEPGDYREYGRGFVAIFSGEFAEERAKAFAYKKNEESLETHRQMHRQMA